MAGRGWSERAKALGIMAKASPRPGRTVPRSKKSPQVERRTGVAVCVVSPGKHAAACYCAPFGAPLPLYQRGGKLKAHLARRRENADAWLFEIRIGRNEARPRNIYSCHRPA